MADRHAAQRDLSAALHQLATKGQIDGWWPGIYEAETAAFGGNRDMARPVRFLNPLPASSSTSSRPGMVTRPSVTKGTSPWLFPGGPPGRPVSAFQLGQRLRQLGLYPGQARSTALFQLATDLPAAVLAGMLGIHIAVAVAWQRASSGDWTNYAADVSRRGQTDEAR